MKNAADKPLHASIDVRQAADGPIPVGARIGTVVALAEGARPRIDFPGNPNGPLVARLALSAADGERLAARWKGAEVLIVFADQDLRQPVITGLVRDSLEDALYQVADWDGFRNLSLRAQEELVLQCGEAKIILRRDGKVVVIGKEILSRAQGRHRIRGATVDIN